MPFVQDAIETGSRVHTDGWLGYEPLRRHGYRHRITFLEIMVSEEERGSVIDFFRT